MRAFRHEQTVEVEGETLTLVINFAALDAIESLLNRSFNDVLAEMGTDSPKVGTTGAVVWGLLRDKHPATTLDEAAGLLFGDTGVAVGLAVGKLIGAAFPPAEAEKATGKNPRAPRGQSPIS